jgi:hypothetical protein
MRWPRARPTVSTGRHHQGVAHGRQKMCSVPMGVRGVTHANVV